MSSGFSSIVPVIERDETGSSIMLVGVDHKLLYNEPYWQAYRNWDENGYGQSQSTGGHRPHRPLDGTRRLIGQALTQALNSMSQPERDGVEAGDSASLSTLGWKAESELESLLHDPNSISLGVPGSDLYETVNGMPWEHNVVHRRGQGRDPSVNTWATTDRPKPNTVVSIQPDSKYEGLKRKIDCWTLGFYLSGTDENSWLQTVSPDYGVELSQRISESRRGHAILSDLDSHKIDVKEAEQALGQVIDSEAAMMLKLRRVPTDQETVPLVHHRQVDLVRKLPGYSELTLSVIAACPRGVPGQPGALQSRQDDEEV